MSKKLKILVGTVTNTAQSAAQAMEMACAHLMDSIEIQMMDGLGIGIFEEDALYVICTSTTGAGDVPDNAQQLYASLSNEPRYLGAVRYGVFALGDSVYPQTFCNGGLRFDERLADLGAVRVGGIFQHDASAGTEPEVEAANWSQRWLPEAQALKAGLPQATSA
ncbi:flavodoxin domain-containing protein [Hydrogenophaga sp.]|uniref:flavodoxin domain-containing protein n=1 Tax=Hydrogenophaga sp. TaxID=1904254 RepID=UPI0035689841